MRNNSVLLTMAVAWLLVSVTVAASSELIISGDASSSECVDASQLAYSVFKSKAPHLYTLREIPDAMDSVLILGSMALENSESSVLEMNEDQFEKVPQLGDAAIRSIYWGKKAQRGTRIIVQEINAGWRGDMYSLYLLDASVDQNDFLKDLQDSYRKSNHSALFHNSWHPPLVFLQGSSHKFWFILVGEPYEILADWMVYKENASGGFTQGCVITFRPQGKGTMSLLPAAVQKFAQLLNETIGPGNNEGTLQATARLRLHTKHVWANVALRPWALSESDTYNSTDEINSGLVAWSRNGSSYRRIHTEILQTHLLAERALSDYYKRKFHLPNKKASRLAKWAIDIAFRANFTFSNGGNYFRYDNINTNPWDVN